MKKFVSILLLTVLVLSVMLPAVCAAETTAWVKTGNGLGLRMREQPSKNAKVIKLLDYGTQLIVHEFRDGWALVEPADWSMSNPYWVSTNFLVYSDPGPRPTSRPTAKPTAKPTARPVDDDDALRDLDSVCKKIKYLSQPYHALIKTSRPTNFVHLRWYPDTSARYIEEYLCDTPILVLAEGGKWAQVQIEEDGYVGFILSANVEPLYE